MVPAPAISLEESAMMGFEAGDQAGITRQVDKLVASVRGLDLDSLRPLFAPDIVSFDAGPPLQQTGVDGKLENWATAFALFQPPIGYEVRDLQIISSGDLGVGHGFARLSGKLKNGTVIGGTWVRVTICFRRLNGSWLIVHDHVSVPVEFESGRAVPNLEP